MKAASRPTRAGRVPIRPAQSRFLHQSAAMSAIREDCPHPRIGDVQDVSVEPGIVEWHQPSDPVDVQKIENRMRNYRDHRKCQQPSEIDGRFSRPPVSAANSWLIQHHRACQQEGKNDQCGNAVGDAAAKLECCHLTPGVGEHVHVGQIYADESTSLNRSASFAPIPCEASAAPTIV